MQPNYKYSKGPIFSRPRRFLVEKRVIFMTLIQIVPTVVMKQTIRSPSPRAAWLGLLSSLSVGRVINSRIMCPSQRALPSRPSV